ncbi:MAG TPA: DUF3566 domain-containing protein [Micromonosporaceae bacterium]
MTETQAKSGAAEAPTTAPEDETDRDSPATGQAVVGRATVPANGAAPKYTRVPGMPPPPDKPTEDDGKAGEGSALSSVDGSARLSSGSTPGGVGTVPGTPAGPGEEKPATDTPRTVIGRIPVPTGAASRVAHAVRAARSTVSSAAARGPRRARLRIKRFDPWSVMKFSAAVSFVLFIVVIVATSVLYLALDTMGVFDSVNGTLTDLVSAGGGGGGFRFTAFGVIGGAALLGLINMVLFTALATLGAFIYNVCADLVGGIEVTLAERD